MDCTTAAMLPQRPLAIFSAPPAAMLAVPMRRPMAGKVVYPNTIVVDGEIIPGRRRPWLKRGPGQVKRHGCWWFIGCDAGIPSWLDHHYRWRADDGREFWFSEPYGITDLARAQLAEVEAAGWRVLIDDQSIAFWRVGAGQ